MKKNLFVLVITVMLVMLVMVGCGSKPTLSEYLDSDDVVAGEEQTNEELAASGLGLSFKFSADGEDILVMSFIYEQYQQLSGLSQSEIAAAYAEEINNMGLSGNMSAMFDACEEATGITLKCIRIQFVNADGSIIYSQDFVDTE